MLHFINLPVIGNTWKIVNGHQEAEVKVSKQLTLSNSYKLHECLITCAYKFVCSTMVAISVDVKKILNTRSSDEDFLVDSVLTTFMKFRTL